MFSSVLPTYFDSEWSFAQCRIVEAYAVSAIKEGKLVIVTKDGGNFYDVELAAGDLTHKEARHFMEPSV